MIYIYIAAALFGGMFLVPMVLGGLDTDIDIGGDFDGGGLDGLDAGTDLDTNISAETDAGDSAADAVGSFVSSLLSFRSIVFFLFFFGFTGIFFRILSIDDIATLVSALALGAVAAVGNAKLFGYLKQSGSSSQRLARDIEGHSAKVILPISGSQKGRIRADLSGQPTFLVAVPFSPHGTFGVGDSVVVVEVKNGTAHVAELDLATSEPTEEK